MTTLTQVASLSIGGALLLMGAGLFASCLRQRSVVAFGLSTYIVAWTILVTFTFALSPFQAVRNTTTWAWLVATLGVALASWLGAGRPVPPVVKIAPPLRNALSDPAVAVLAGLSAVGVAYAALLALATPENEGDALAYHVARAAFWYQSHAVGYIPDAIETRLNINPPNAEIGELFTMLVSGTQRFVGVVQFLALLACALGTIGVARRIGYRHSEALFGALLLLSLPVVITQSWTAMNDLLVASFLVAAAYFLLGGTRVDTVLAGLAIALAIGTKFTAVLALPLLALLPLVGTPGARAPSKRLASAVVIGGTCGSVWYLVNIYETGKPDGGLAADAGQTPAYTPAAILDALRHYVFDVLDLSGTADSGWLWYFGLGIVVSTVGAAGILARRRNPGFRIALEAGLLVAAAPLLVAFLYLGLYRVVGDATIVGVPNSSAGATQSWFGPLGTVAVAAGAVVAVVGTRRGRSALVVPVLAFAPVALTVILALEITWDPWRGRFLIFAFALAAASWGGFLRHRWLAWGIAGAAGTTMMLALATSQSKPLGVWPLSSGSTTTVWGKPGWYTQSILRLTEGERGILRFAETTVPDHASLTIAPRGNEFLSHYFGRNLTRQIDLVTDGQAVGRRSEWLIAAPGVRPSTCPMDWSSVYRSRDGWLIARRIGASACELERLSEGDVRTTR